VAQPAGAVGDTNPWAAGFVRALADCSTSSPAAAPMSLTSAAGITVPEEGVVESLHALTTRSAAPPASVEARTAQ
jgi:hypothetical protein